MRALRWAACLATTVLVAGCGVSTQDEPDPITTPAPTTTPTMTTRPEPSPPCPPLATAGQSSATRQVQSTAATPE